MGTWAYSYNFVSAVALGERAKEVIEKDEDITDFDGLLAAFNKFTPGADWNGSNYTNVDGVERENFYLLYQDTYIFGKGYLKMTDIEIPEKYFKIK